MSKRAASPRTKSTKKSAAVPLVCSEPDSDCYGEVVLLTPSYPKGAVPVALCTMHSACSRCHKHVGNRAFAFSEEAGRWCRDRGVYCMREALDTKDVLNNCGFACTKCGAVQSALFWNVNLASEGGGGDYCARCSGYCEACGQNALCKWVEPSNVEDKVFLCRDCRKGGSGVVVIKK